MENCSSYSHPESGGSSPRSRETDLENPPPSSEDSSSNYRLKFMVSYGGKIQPRSHDNLLSYVGGDTKILAAERGVKFNLLLSKLSSLIPPDNEAGLNPNSFTFKYQLPGEDLDALISVTNDDDLQHMMHEYDRMSRSSSKPTRLRLFLFPKYSSSGFSSTSSDQGKLDPARFVEPLPDTFHSSPPLVAAPVVLPPPMPTTNKVDILFGLDNRVPVQAHVPVQVAPAVSAHSTPANEPDLVNEMNRLQVSALDQQQHAAAYRQQSEQNLAANYAGEMNQKGPTPPSSITASEQIQAGYWPAMEQHHQTQQQRAPQQQYHQQPPYQQPVYMMHVPQQSTMYHVPVVRPTPQTQGYYQVQRMPSDPVYREQPVYSMPAPASVSMPMTSNQGAARPVGESAGYQVGYDSTGRQVYYTTAAMGGIVAAPYEGVAGAALSGGQKRGSADGKVVQKVVNTSGGM